jgi:hypothetical protein
VVRSNLLSSFRQISEPSRFTRSSELIPQAHGSRQSVEARGRARIAGVLPWLGRCLAVRSQQPHMIFISSGGSELPCGTTGSPDSTLR